MLEYWLLKPAAALVLLGTAYGWIGPTLRHGSHLHQTAETLKRLHRLSCRVSGCVGELHHYLTAQIEPASEVPEAIVGHMHYLHAIRQECKDHASRAARHSIRQRWGDGYLPRLTPTANKCALAAQHVELAANSIAQACKVYEAGVIETLLSGGARTSRLTSPISGLNEESADQLVGLRENFDEAVRAVADIIQLDAWSLTMYESTWPIRVSELPDSPAKLYRGEVRPMGWTGFGPQPILHVDAR